MTRTGLILLAEDDPDDRLLVEQAFRTAGIQTPLAFAEDGEELLDYLHQRGAYAGARRPSVILLDLNMPRKDGREALAEIKADPDLRSIPVVVLTTSSTPEDVRQVYALGANAFVTKPVGFEALVEVAERIGSWWFRIAALPT